MAKATFLGACGTVTGSCTLLSFGQERVLVDCGLFQGPEELEQRNREPFPFDAASVSAVVLTHAHLDHTGRLPKLVAEGFRGPVYCSKPTRGLLALVLQDAAKLQEEEAGWARRKGYARVASPAPLFTEEDVRLALSLVRRIPFDQPFELLPGVQVTMRRAGHLLGAASLEVSAKGSDGERRRWLFSGDVGRYGVPILHDPQPAQEAPDTVLLESTYGDRRHTAHDAKAGLRTVIRETFARGGSLLIPSFALGRTQDLLYHLDTLADERVVDADDVFIDSPMAISATELYRDFVDEHDEELSARIAGGGGSPFAADRFQRCRTSQQSKALNARQRPAVIIAGSGMVNGGRILHHLRHRLPDPRHTLLFVGYQGAGTRGRALLDGASVVAIHGVEVPVAAEVRSLPSLSAHADHDELLRWARALPGVPRRTFLNHGEDPARKALARALQTELGWPLPQLPLHGQTTEW
jgi:metallo-beta-lactamase family protein